MCMVLIISLKNGIIQRRKSNLAITVPNKFLRFMIISPGYVNEGDYVGIRIVNIEEGFNLDIAAIFIKYD
jgi:hypothetical protein